MSNFNQNVLIIDLQRSDTSVPWGFRLEGGADIGEPLRIVKVVQGSVAERAGLFAGDYVVALNRTPAHSMSHEAAKMEIIRSANEVTFTISRGRQTSVIVRGGMPSNRNQQPVSVTSARIIIPNNNSNMQKRPHSYHAQRQQPTYQQPPPLSPRIAQKPVIKNSFNAAPQPFAASPPPIITKDTTGRMKKVSHNQYNSPMGLYSSNNVKNVMDKTMKVAAAPQQASNPIAQQGKTLFCHKCGDMIKGVFVRVHGQYPMHQSCLKCCKCGVGLQHAGYFYIDDYLYCEMHAKQASGTMSPGSFSNAVYN